MTFGTTRTKYTINILEQAPIWQYYEGLQRGWSSTRDSDGQPIVAGTFHLGYLQRHLTHLHSHSCSVEFRPPMHILSLVPYDKHRHSGRYGIGPLTNLDNIKAFWNSTFVGSRLYQHIYLFTPPVPRELCQTGPPAGIFASEGQAEPPQAVTEVLGLNVSEALDAVPADSQTGPPPGFTGELSDEVCGENGRLILGDVWAARYVQQFRLCFLYYSVALTSICVTGYAKAHTRRMGRFIFSRGTAGGTPSNLECMHLSTTAVSGGTHVMLQKGTVGSSSAGLGYSTTTSRKRLLQMISITSTQVIEGAHCSRLVKQCTKTTLIRKSGSITSGKLPRSTTSAHHKEVSTSFCMQTFQHGHCSLQILCVALLEMSLPMTSECMYADNCATEEEFCTIWKDPSCTKSPYQEPDASLSGGGIALVVMLSAAFIFGVAYILHCRS